MYRLVTPEQRPPFFDIARKLLLDQPETFAPTTESNPHVAIMPRKPVANYLGYGQTGGIDKIGAFKMRIGQALPATKSRPVLALCTGIEIFSNHLGIIIESEIVTEEIDLAYKALGLWSGLSYDDVDKRAHISLGGVLQSDNEEMCSELVDAATEACREMLPADQLVRLGAIAYASPKI